MKTILSFLFFICSFLLSYSQTELLNQFDSSGKKDGKWTVYLNSFGDKVNDTSNAAYCRYTYYEHGVNIYPMGGFIYKKGKIETTNSDKDKKIKLLDGEYKCLDKKGRTKFIHVFKNGEYVSYKDFYKSGKVHSYFDYTKHYDGQPHSWYMYIYDKYGSLKYESWVKKDENGRWPYMHG